MDECSHYSLSKGNVSQRDHEVFSDDKHKNLRLSETRNSNVKEKLTPNSSVGKNTLRRQINALIKEISKRRSRIKTCLQCDPTVRSDYLGCKHQPKKNGASTQFCKMKKEILSTFLHDPVSPLMSNFHKKHVYKAKMKLTRSLSCPLPRGYAMIKPINNGSLSKWKGKSYSGNKWRLNGKINKNEVAVVRDVNFSSGSSQVHKPIKNLRQKLDHVTGESGKEKLRVAMDGVIHKIPRGRHGISDELKNEILKKLTESNVTRKFEYLHRNSIRRIWSLQEPLESYCQYQENSFKTENAHPPLKTLIPFKRIHSLPDLQSYSLASHYGEIYKRQLQLDALAEDLTQENLVNVDENDHMAISSIIGSRSDSIRKINGNADIIIDELVHSGLKKSGTLNNQEDIGPIKEYKVATEASDSKCKPGHVEQQEANMDYSLKVNDITNFYGDPTNKDEYNYVKYVLEISGLTSDECHSAWHSRDIPVDPLLYEEMESDPDFCTYDESGKCNHHVLFDLINETLLEIYGRSYCYTPMKFTIHEVWNHMRKILCLRSKVGHQRIEDHVNRDLSEVDRWVKNLQFYIDYVGLELEDLIFHDLTEEIIWDLGCF